MIKDTIITVIGTITFLIVVIFVVLAILHKVDSKIWNNGYCDCGGKWKYEQAIGHRASSSYIYKCDKCEKRIELRFMQQEVK